MKKIMFNDSYGLTKAVLEGRKTMTRRVISKEREDWLRIVDGDNTSDWYRHGAKYLIREVVAVAQSYMDAGYDPHMLQLIDIKEPTILPFSDGLPVLGYVDAPIMYHAGWKNKMFVYPTMMPHQIRITNVRVERLQEITDADCKREGIDYIGGYSDSYYFGHGVGDLRLGNSCREAFAALIDKVSGKGTWESNPWVFVYEFELVK